MIDVNAIEIDGKDYMVIGALEVNNNKYLALGNKDNTFDYTFRKVIKENGEDFLVKLDSEEELEVVLKEYREKYCRKGEKNYQVY